MKNLSLLLSGFLYLFLSSEVAIAQAPATNAVIKYFNSNGVKIACIDVGKVEPVIRLHGFAISLDIFRNMRNHFVQARYPFIARAHTWAAPPKRDSLRWA